MSADDLSVRGSRRRDERDGAGGETPLGLAGTSGDEAGAMDRALVGADLRGLIH